VVAIVDNNAMYPIRMSGSDKNTVLRQRGDQLSKLVEAAVKNQQLIVVTNASAKNMTAPTRTVKLQGTFSRKWGADQEKGTPVEVLTALASLVDDLVSYARGSEVITADSFLQGYEARQVTGFLVNAIQTGSKLSF